jgi:serine phosphatase RsbU (regulator of sigma subunit)
MRIRTQIILAAFVLAVIPLAAIVTYSYHSSRRALEGAYRREAQRTTAQMDNRLASIRTELDQRMTFVSALPVEEGSAPSDVGSIMTVMGESALLVDALEFQPLPPPPQPPPAAAAEASRDEIRLEVMEERHESLRSLAGLEEAITAAVRASVEPLVIDLPASTPIVRHVMSKEQMELVSKIGQIAGKLGKPGLSAEERGEIRREMEEMQRELQKTIARDTAAITESGRERDAVIRSEIASRARVPRPPRPPIAEPVAGSASAVAEISGGTSPSTQSQPARPAPANFQVRGATAGEIERSIETAKKTALILGRRFEAPLHKQGEVVGQLSARVSPEEVIRRVLGSAPQDGSEIPFALDREGTLYTRSNEERRELEQLSVPDRIRRGQSLKGISGWVVSASTDPQSGLQIGVARRVGENLDELRRAAAKNLGLGLGLIAFALIGIVPLSNHLTRDVKLVTTGAERIAQGDLQTRLPVKSDNELGQLARAFNRMAEDLSVNQQKLVEQERATKEQELQQRLLAVEYERKSDELEDARRFQLSMLPKVVPQHEAFDVAVFTKTATEVGGDYYDFHVEDEKLSVTIGDATGHGAKAGTMVTVVKTLFAGYHEEIAPSEFLRDAAERIRRMDLGRMAMALCLARFEGATLTLASAGMPPLFVHRAGRGTVEEIGLGATPLGTMGGDYAETSVVLEPGDTILLLTDGFPELMNDEGQQIGYTAAADLFAAAARASDAAGVIDSLAGAARRWHGETAPNDDVTFVVVRLRPRPPARPTRPPSLIGS